MKKIIFVNLDLITEIGIRVLILIVGLDEYADNRKFPVFRRVSNEQFILTAPNRSLKNEPYYVVCIMETNIQKCLQF